MAIIKNAILQPLQRLIGISPGTQATVLDTASVSLTMPIVPDVARRSLASQPSGGIFQGVLENVHSGADQEVSSIEPYAAGDNAVPPYPAEISSNFDLWLIGVHGIRSSGAGALTGGLASITFPAHTQGWGQDDQGAAVISNRPVRVAEFDDISVLSGTPEVMITAAGLTYVRAGIRLVRGCALDFHSRSGGIAEFQMTFLLGLFPAALGQDVAT